MPDSQPLLPGAKVVKRRAKAEAKATPKAKAKATPKAKAKATATAEAKATPKAKAKATATAKAKADAASAEPSSTPPPPSEMELVTEKSVEAAEGKKRAQGSTTFATKGSSTFSLEAGMALVGCQNNKLTAAQLKEFLKACAWGLFFGSA